MNTLSYEFNAAQRRTVDRYISFLCSLAPTFNNMTAVFECRRKEGHLAAVLPKDLRINNARFNERYLREFSGRVDQTKRLFNTSAQDLATFTQESLAIAKQTSRNEPIDNVDFKLYSLSRSRTWMLYPPRNVRDLIHELYLRFDDVSSAIRQLKYTIREVREESFGLKSVFMQAMDYETCQCHPQPRVAHALFSQAGTAPVWDIVYSSSAPALRATEYKADIARLFTGFASVSAQMGLFIEDLQQRIEDATVELLRARDVSRLGELNFKLGGVSPSTEECLAMLNHLEEWLRQ